MASDLDRRTRFLDSIVGKGVSDYGALSAELRKFYGSDLTLWDS
jgi:hypothetical protein